MSNSKPEHDVVGDEVDAVETEGQEEQKHPQWIETEPKIQLEEPAKQNTIGPQGPEMNREARVQEKALAAATKQEVKAIGLSELGVLKPTDSAEEWRIADMMLKSNALPSVFKNVPQVIMALQFLRAHGIQPAIGIRQTTIVNGMLSIWGELPKALCERSGQIEDFEEFLFDKDYNRISFENKNLHVEPMGAICRLKRKDKKPIERTFTIEEAKKADLLGKDTWKKYPRRMLQMRSRSWALKDEFPDVLSGVAISEYDFDQIGPGDSLPVEAPMQHSKNFADEINQEYVGEAKTGAEPQAAQSSQS